LAPIGGTRYFKWKLRACWKNEGRLKGMTRPSVKTKKMGGGKCPNYAWSRGFEKVQGWDPSFTWRVGGW